MTTLADRFKAALDAFKMPQIYKPGGSRSTLPTVDPLFDSLPPQEYERVQLWFAYRSYYDGLHKRNLPLSPEGVDDNIVLNFCRTIVNRGASFLIGEGVEFDTVLESDDEIMEDVYDSWGMPEQRYNLLMELAITGGIYGTAYLMISDTREKKLGKLTVSMLDPTQTYVFVDAETNEPVEYQIRFSTPDYVRRRRIIGNGTSWDYVTEEYRRSGVWDELPDTRGRWPWAWSPITTIKNMPNPQRSYGVSDLHDMDINDAVNAMASFVQRTTRIYSSPLLYGYGVNKESLTTGKFYHLNQPDGFINSVQIHSAIGEAVNNMQVAVNYLHMVADTPAFDPTVMSLGTQSGFALRVLHGPLLARNLVKRATYGTGLNEINTRLAAAYGYPDIDFTCVWDDPLPEAEDDIIARDKFEVGIGVVSKETVAKRRGIDWEREKERILAEKESDEGPERLIEAAMASFDAGNPIPGDVSADQTQFDGVES